MEKSCISVSYYITLYLGDKKFRRVPGIGVFLFFSINSVLINLETFLFDNVELSYSILLEGMFCQCSVPLLYKVDQ